MQLMSAKRDRSQRNRIAVINEMLFVLANKLHSIRKYSDVTTNVNADEVWRKTQHEWGALVTHKIIWRYFLLQRILNQTKWQQQNNWISTLESRVQFFFRSLFCFFLIRFNENHLRLSLLGQNIFPKFKNLIFLLLLWCCCWRHVFDAGRNLLSQCSLSFDKNF